MPIIVIAMENIFGKRLKELRKALGITQSELAEGIGTSQSAIAEYESGRKSPTVPVIIRIVKFFNVSADYLLGLTDNPQPWNNDLPEQVKRQLKECERLREKYAALLRSLEGLLDSHRR